MEAGGTPAGLAYGGYLVGETVKLLGELNIFDGYDIIIFDVLGEVVYGGFAVSLNHEDYCLINKYIKKAVPMPVLEVLPLIEDIRVSRVQGKTLFEMSDKNHSLEYICGYYLNIADQLLAMSAGVVPNNVQNRELFTLLSNFYLT